MKRRTYEVISSIPIFGRLAKIICDPYLFSSQGRADGTYDALLEYMKKHPDVLMTNKLAEEVYQGKVK